MVALSVSLVFTTTSEQNHKNLDSHENCLICQGSSNSLGFALGAQSKHRPPDSVICASTATGGSHLGPWVNDRVLGENEAFLLELGTVHSACLCEGVYTPASNVYGTRAFLLSDLVCSESSTRWNSNLGLSKEACSSICSSKFMKRYLYAHKCSISGFNESRKDPY